MLSETLSTLLVFVKERPQSPLSTLCTTFSVRLVDFYCARPENTNDNLLMSMCKLREGIHDFSLVQKFLISATSSLYSEKVVPSLVSYVGVRRGEGGTSKTSLCA
jgi:hypothetical protein